MEQIPGRLIRSHIFISCCWSCDKNLSESSLKLVVLLVTTAAGAIMYIITSALSCTFLWSEYSFV